MLKEASNNNDDTRVANIMLNEVPNSNDNENACLTTMGAQQCSMVAI